MIKPKSIWVVENQRWIHPPQVVPPPVAPGKPVPRPNAKSEAKPPAKLGRPSNTDLDRGLQNDWDEMDRRYEKRFAKIERDHQQWLADQERKFGVVHSRDEQGGLVVEMSERFAALLLHAKAAGDLALYPAGDARGFVASTDPTQSWGWKDADAAAKYGAEVQEILQPGCSENAGRWR